MKLLARKTFRWFLIAGAIGIVIAVLIEVIHVDNPIIMVLLWPSSILGLANPQTLADDVIVGLAVFGGQFLLYGAFGAIAGRAGGPPKNDYTRIFPE